MKGILLLHNYLKFPLVKVIVRKIACKSVITTKNSGFLRTDHRNAVHENFFRCLGDIICIKNLIKSIRIFLTNSWAIWTRIGEDIDHFSKRPASPPKKTTSWPKILSNFSKSQRNFTFLILLTVSSQVALNVFYGFKNYVRIILGLLWHRGLRMHVESRS